MILKLNTLMQFVYIVSSAMYSNVHSIVPVVCVRLGYGMQYTARFLQNIVF